MKKFRKLILIALGAALDALGVAAFILPGGFVAGGVTGLGRVFNNYFHVKVATVVAVISILLLMAAFFAVGKKMAARIVMCSVLFPFFLNIFTSIPALDHLTDNMMLSAIFGGVVCGFGLGIIIRSGASSGGSDVIPVILNHRFGWPIGPMLYITDSIILIIQFPFANVDDVLYGLISLMICSIVVNKVILIGSSDVQFMIVSQKHDEINYELQNTLSVGSTLLHAHTGHLYDPMDMIVCVVPHEYVHKVKETVLAVDPEAFMTLVNVSDVNGRGFTMAKRWI